ncbi:MAG: hypothetical protein ABJP06_04185 [Sulfitobacter sp.]
MTYLLTQIFLYLLAAFVLGLFLGWLIWRYGKPSASEIDAIRAENTRLKSDLDSCTRKTAKLEAQAQVPAPTPAPAPVPAPAAPVAVVEDTAPVPAEKPEGLSAPRGGTADELQLIHGVGPKMEGMLHDLGYYHFDQIANWTPAEVAWVDDNLEGFKGRVTRDKWQPQAKVLAKG